MVDRPAETLIFQLLCQPMGLLTRIYGDAYGKLTLIGCGPDVARQTGNDRHSWKRSLKFWAHLVPRNMVTKTACSTKHK